MDFSADAAELTMQQLLLPRSWYILHMLWEETLHCVLRGSAAHDASRAAHWLTTASAATQRHKELIVGSQSNRWESGTLRPQTEREQRHRRPPLVDAGPRCLVRKKGHQRRHQWREDQAVRGISTVEFLRPEPLRSFRSKRKQVFYFIILANSNYQPTSPVEIALTHGKAPDLQGNPPNPSKSH